MDNQPHRRTDRGATLGAHGGAMRTTRLIRRLPWDAWLRALVLVKLGQELGTASPLAKAVHDLANLVLTIGR